MVFKKAIWGPPGSGKTAELARLVREKVENENMLLSEIAACTFRKPLAHEFKRRLMSELDVDRNELYEGYFGTTHAICYRLLAEGNYTTEVAQPEDRKGFCEQFGVDYTITSKKAGLWADVRIPGGEKLGNALFNIHSFLVNNPDAHWKESPNRGRWEKKLLGRGGVVETFRKGWEKYKEENGFIDFTDMLKMVYEEGLYPPVEILLEDEFHDKTPLQYRIYKQWEGVVSEVYLAGDPLQAMYSFWGTDPKFFKWEFEDADEQKVLKKSHRFSPHLWSYARQIVDRYGLDTPEVQAVGEGTHLDYLNMRGFRKKAEEHRGDDVLYLGRTNYLLKSITEELDRLGIPYSVGYERSSKTIDVYNAISYLHTVLEGAPVMAHHSVELEPGETRALLASFPAECFPDQKKELKRKAEEAERTSDLVHLEVTPRLKAILEKKNPFYEMLASAPVPEGKREHLAEMWERRGGEKIGESSRHTVSTIHGAKGREADVVFLFDPITRRIQERSDQEEEARIFYVGATRARNRLFVVCMSEADYNYDLPVPERRAGIRTPSGDVDAE